MRQFIRYYPKMCRNRDEACMRRYLNKVMVTGLNNTQLGSLSAFLPAGAPSLISWLYTRSTWIPESIPSDLRLNSSGEIGDYLSPCFIKLKYEK